MTIGETLAIHSVTAGAPSRSSSGPSPEQAARNRELIEAVRTINEAGAVGPSSELRFAIDRNTGQPLIRIVDRVTDEVIQQVPSEVVLRTAEVLRSLQKGEFIG